MYTPSVKVSKKSAPEVVAVAMRAFPSYTGRKFKVRPFSGPMSLVSGWDGGSREEYRVVPLVQRHPADPSQGVDKFCVPENGTFPTQNGGRTCTLSDLPEGLALVCHSIFCGKDAGLTVIVNPANFNSNLIKE